MATVRVTLGSILPNLPTLFERKEFCDLQIICNQPSSEILAHRVVLASSSELFYQIFSQSSYLGNAYNGQIHTVYLNNFSYGDIANAVKLIYHGAIDIPDSEVATFLDVCSELKIAGLPHLNAGLPLLNAGLPLLIDEKTGLPIVNAEELKNVESLAKFSEMPSSGSSDVGSPDAQNLAAAFKFEESHVAVTGLSMDEIDAAELPLDLVVATGLPIDQVGPTGVPAEQVAPEVLTTEQVLPTGLPAEQDSPIGLSDEQGSSSGLPVPMEEDESVASQPKRPRVSKPEGASSIVPEVAKSVEELTLQNVEHNDDKSNLVQDGDKTKCLVCNKRYASASSARTHVREKHSNSEKTIQCHICKSEFKLERYLKSHMKTKHQVAPVTTKKGAAKLHV